MLARSRMLVLVVLPTVVAGPGAAGPVPVLPATESVLTAPVPRGGAHFGGEIAACDDLLVVGARDDDLFANNGGAVYVYRKTPTGLVYSATLEPPMEDQENDLWFGADVDLICGAPLQFIAVGFVPSSPDLGGAYVFERIGLDSWELVGTVAPGVGRTIDDWGTVVAADAWYDGGWIYRVALGGPDAHSGTTSVDFVGAVAVFQRQTRFDWQGGTLIQANELAIPGDQGNGDAFGAAVALRGPWLVVGAPGDDSAGGLDVGAVYFLTDGVQRSKLVPDGLGAGASFGWDVSADLFWIAAAALNDPDVFTSNTGAVYLYSIFGFPDLIPPPQDPVIEQYTQRLTLPASSGGSIAKVEIDTPYLVAGRDDDDVALGLWVRTGLDTWGLQGIVEPSTMNHPVSGGIAMDGSFLYGGVPFEDVMSVTDAGSVFAWDVIELRPLFEDGFESGDTSAWVAVSP